MTDLPNPGSQPAMINSGPEDDYAIIRSTNVIERGITLGAADAKSTIYQAR